jgi:hypothetical protein
MDNVKLESRSTIGILDLIRVNKKVDHMTKDARARISLYIAKIIHAFLQEDKKTIKISYFSSKFHSSFQFCIEI